jgi:hypothetical protein
MMPQEFEPSTFNPRIEMARSPRLINITDSRYVINGIIHWDVTKNTWGMDYSVMEYHRGLCAPSPNELGVFTDLKIAVELACSAAGIVANDPRYRQRQEELEKINAALASLDKMKEILGDSNIISPLEKRLKNHRKLVSKS